MHHVQGGNKHDVESLEQENDQSLDALGDRVGMLKKVIVAEKAEAAYWPWA